MKFFQNRRNLLIIWLCVIGLAALASMVEMTIERRNNPAEIKVEIKDRDLRNSEADSLRPVIKSFKPDVTVKGQPYLMVQGNSRISFLAPGDQIEDPVYATLIMALCIIFLVRAKKIRLDKPFSQQLIEGIEWAGITCIAFAVIDYWRRYYINKYVIQQTDNIYHLERFSFTTSTILWAGIFLFWLHRILRKAQVLQTEQELTV